MKKRTFIKTIALGSASVLSSALWTGCGPDEVDTQAIQDESNRRLPDNWIWLRPKLETKPDEWKAIFEKLKSSGIDAILPQVYGGKDTLFDHPTLPVKERWLEKIIPLAHAAGLQVHAWMWTMPLNNQQMVEQHPDWFSVNRNGDPAHTHPAYVGYYKFMCPCHPEVQEFVAGNVRALAKIEDLDGIHLDYVRQPDVILAEALQPKYNIVQDKEYPEYDYPYSKYCRDQFKAQSGIDPMDLGDEAPHHKEWRQFRYDAVSNVVNNYCVPEARKYDKMISAAVFPNWESVRQQWHRWDLDAFLPMLYQGFYNKNISWIGEEVKNGLGRMQEKKPVYAGLFLPHLPKAEDLKAAIKVSKASGARGVSLFALGNMKEDYYSVLKNDSK